MSSSNTSHGKAPRRAPEPAQDRFGVRVPSAMPSLDARELLIARLLGRLDLMSLDQLRVAAAPTMSGYGFRQVLEQMEADDLIWKLSSRTVAANQVGQYEKVRRQSAYVYGLATAGKELLTTLEVERDPLTIDRLVSRDPRGRKPDTRTMSHDLQVSWWCLNVILSAAYNRACRKIYVQTEFYSEKSQRIDALVILRLNPDHPRPAESVGPIPFFDGTPPAAGDIDIRLALEIDRGTEELSVLTEKNQTYRDLHRAGVYTETLGGPVLVTYLVQTARRAKQLAAKFQAVWPNGWGVVGTPLGVNHPKDGVLWGNYRTLTSDQPFALLTHLAVDTSGHLHYFPVISRENWRQLDVTPAFEESPEQIAGRHGGKTSGARRQALRKAREEPK